jgi:cysteine desulfurase
MIPSSPRIYLDNNATTRMDDRVALGITNLLSRCGMNPASQHHEGRQARRLVEDSRDMLLQLLGARTRGMSSDRLLFTSGGTEANNLAILGLSANRPGTLIVSAIEHPSVLEAAKIHQQKRSGSVRYLPVDVSGVVRIDILEQWFAELKQGSQPISVVSVMLANNETGVLQPLDRIVSLAHSYGAIVHTDAVQAIGKTAFDFLHSDVDALTFTAHKLHGPIGIGGLLLRSNIELEPMMYGGFQQLGLRPGTESSLLTTSFAESVRLAMQFQADAVVHMTMLRQRFENGIRNQLPDIVIHGEIAERLPHTISVAFPRCDRQALQMALDMAGIACSTGSACASGSSQPSHVLNAMQVGDDLLQSSLRFSLSRQSTLEEIDLAIDRIAQTVTKLRDRSQSLQPHGSISS